MVASTVMVVLMTLPATTRAAESWDWSITPYMWASDITMDVAVNGDPVLGIDVVFSDLLDKVDFVFQFHFEGRRGRAGFFIDGTFIELTVDDLTSGGGMLPPATGRFSRPSSLRRSGPRCISTPFSTQPG